MRAGIPLLVTMKRRIESFFRDEEDDWVARLECGHTQHMRHRPPFTNRPWVMSEDGRASRVGVAVECPECDRETEKYTD